MVSETDVMYMSTLQEINTILFFFGGELGNPCLNHQEKLLQVELIIDSDSPMSWTQDGT